MPRCVQCREQFEDNDRFCTFCGTPITVDLATGHYNRALDAGERGDLGTTITELNECLCCDPLPRIAVVAYFNLGAAIWTQYNFGKRDGASISDEEFRWAERAFESLRRVREIYETALAVEDQSSEPLHKLYVEAKKRLESTAGYGALSKDLSGRKSARDKEALASAGIAPLTCLDLPIPAVCGRTADGDSGDPCAFCGCGNRFNYAFCRQCGQNSNGASALDPIPPLDPIGTPELHQESAGTGQINAASVPVASGEFTASSGRHRPGSGRTQWSPRRRRRKWVIASFAIPLLLSGAYGLTFWQSRSRASKAVTAAHVVSAVKPEPPPVAQSLAAATSSAGVPAVRPEPVPSVARVDLPSPKEPRVSKGTPKAADDQKHALELQRREIDAQREELERQRLQIEQQKREQEAQRLRDESEKSRRQEEIEKAQRDAESKQREVDQQRRRVLEDEQAKKKAVEERRYTGPSSGSLTWEGQVDGLQLVEIENGSANVGTVNGTLPGVACMIQPSDAKRVIIADPPRPANRFNRLVFRVQGKGHVSVRFSWVVQ